MANITLNTDDLIARSIELEREKAAVLADISSHRDRMRGYAADVNDKQFRQFVENFYPAKERGVTQDTEAVKARAQWKRDLLKSHGVETNGSGE